MFVVLFIDIITTILLAFFWNFTININGHAWHMPLIVLAFIGGVNISIAFDTIVFVFVQSASRVIFQAMGSMSMVTFFPMTASSFAAGQRVTCVRVAEPFTLTIHILALLTFVSF